MKIIMIVLVVLLLSYCPDRNAQNPSKRPVRIAIAGLTHDHAHLFFRKHDQREIALVGVFVPNQERAERYSKRYGINP